MNKLLPLLLLLLPCCATLQEGNHPTLEWLDEQLPEPSHSLESLTLGIAILPVAIPAGAIDTFIANPAIQAPHALDSTQDIVWNDSKGSLFYQSALFIPKLVVTPIVFVFTWSTHIAFGE